MIAPLDWGMGHTTRCVPLIKHLQERGHLVTVAGNEWQRTYLQATFPGIDSLHLEGYNVHYGRTGGRFMLTLLGQLPRLLRTIKAEQRQLRALTAQKHFDGIISDNRYGLYHSSIPTLILTHQLQPVSGMGAGADKIFRPLHYRLLERYDTCAVPDVRGAHNLSGSLGHPSALPKNTHYIGLLSQAEPCGAEEEKHLLILLSGPEPQRSILSQKLWKQVSGHYTGKVVFVEGTDNAETPAHIPPHITYHKRITGEVLRPLMCEAKMVICRSGYSTLMDLAVTGKKAILIPTPGQTEQEYLGRHLHDSGVYYSAPQESFDLSRALSEAAHFPFKSLGLGKANELYKTFIDEWLAAL